MQALDPTDSRTPTLTPALSADAAPNQSLAPSDLQWLGERLRIAYGPVEASGSTSARLTELVERLARNESQESRSCVIGLSGVVPDRQSLLLHAEKEEKADGW